MSSIPAPEAVTDPALIAAVEFARAAAQAIAGSEVGAPVSAEPEGDDAVTHLFDADKPGYRGWRWAVTVSSAGPGSEVTVSEVVLVPGPEALTAPAWVPWHERVQAGDLGVGDLLPTDPDDERLAQAYVESDDPAVEETAAELGLGRVRVMSRIGRLDAAERWHTGEFGPSADMAKSAPAHCGTCGFYLRVAGSLGAAFGVCGNELAPADGRVVHAEYGCGAHSEAEVEQISPVLVADLIYDDATLDYEPKAASDAPSAPEADAEAAVEGDAADAAEPVADAAEVAAGDAESAAVEADAPESEAPDAATPAADVPDSEAPAAGNSEAPEPAADVVDTPEPTTDDFVNPGLPLEEPPPTLGGRPLASLSGVSGAAEGLSEAVDGFDGVGTTGTTAESADSGSADHPSESTVDAADLGESGESGEARDQVDISGDDVDGSGGDQASGQVHPVE